MKTATAEPSPSDRDEPMRVREWRHAQLLRAGFDGEDAALLAAHLEIDVHVALGLVERGCPPKTALKILL